MRLILCAGFRFFENNYKTGKTIEITVFENAGHKSNQLPYNPKPCKHTTFAVKYYTITYHCFYWAVIT
jgi:hypothetical protein